MTVVRSNALQLPLRDASVDLVVTSPPYFALRSYRDGDEHYDGQIGSEPGPDDFLDALWTATAEMARVLKPTGSIWVNLGDKYAGSGGHNNWHKAPLEGGKKMLAARGEWQNSAPYNATRRDAPDRYNQNSGGIPAKSLMGLPWRYAIGCIDRLGLILRAEVIWSKPNGLPEPATDRVRRSHEQWFHFVKQGKYFSAVDEIRETYTVAPHAPGNIKWADERNDADRTTEVWGHPLGKLPGSVWTIATEPLVIPTALGLPDHFAAFPQEWPRRIILGWSPPGICSRCGEGRRPVCDVERTSNEGYRPPRYGVGEGTTLGPRGVEATIVGYACGCTPYTDHPGTGERHANPPCNRGVNVHLNMTKGALGDAPRVGPWREYHVSGWVAPPTTPAVVLDPFGGTGTVAMVARALGRVGLSVDLSADYCRLARWRVYESGHGAKTEERTWAERQQALF